MPTIHKDNLVRPSEVSVVSRQVRRQSTSGNLVFTTRPDATLSPRTFVFVWRDAFGAVADSVRRHYDEHARETFTVKLPRTGETVTVRWASAPSLDWGSAVAASMTAELEELLAHE